MENDDTLITAQELFDDLMAILTDTSMLIETLYPIVEKAKASTKEDEKEGFFLAIKMLNKLSEAWGASARLTSTLSLLGAVSLEFTTKADGEEVQ